MAIFCLTLWKTNWTQRHVRTKDLFSTTSLTLTSKRGWFSLVSFIHLLINEWNERQIRVCPKVCLSCSDEEPENQDIDLMSKTPAYHKNITPGHWYTSVTSVDVYQQSAETSRCVLQNMFSPCMRQMISWRTGCKNFHRARRRKCVTPRRNFYLAWWDTDNSAVLVTHCWTTSMSWRFTQNI